MKYLILILLVYVFSCGKERDYCSECVVGNKYMLYGPYSGSPFEKQAIAPVIITDKKDGWVQYCWEHEYEKKDKAQFSRTCKEFIELTEHKATGSLKKDEGDIKISPGSVNIVIDSGNNNNINVQQ